LKSVDVRDSSSPLAPRNDTEHEFSNNLFEAHDHGQTNFFWLIKIGHMGTHEAQLADFNRNRTLDILGKSYRAGAPGVNLYLNPSHSRRR